MLVRVCEANNRPVGRSSPGSFDDTPSNVATSLDLPAANCIRSECRTSTAGNLREVITKVNGKQSEKISYGYGNSRWTDSLTELSVNGVTKSISYGEYCNPKSWYNGTSYSSLTWTQGRRLSSLKTGGQTCSYEYDMSGVRSVKVAEGLRHEYVTQNGKVVRDRVTDASTGAFRYMLDFTYDESGHPLTMRQYLSQAQDDYSTYHYVLKAQGDVIKLMHGPDKTVAEYTYDAWGRLLNISGAELGNLTVANVNPLRYRGYYCDTETGFYYLQSRYYDPIVRRFLNADSYASTGHGIVGYNMFAYCGNNPVMCIDTGGEDYIWQRLFEDGHFGFIHLAVQWHIVQHHPELQMERAVYNSDKKQCGRADIFNLKTGEIWEIKTVRTGAEAAYKQVTKYCEDGNSMAGCREKLKKGYPYISDEFSLACMNDGYKVVYHSPQPGVILYKVDKSQPQKDPYASYVPVAQTTPELQSSIGGIPPYGAPSYGPPTYVSAGVLALACVAIGAACFGGGGGGGYCYDYFREMGYGSGYRFG